MSGLNYFIPSERAKGHHENPLTRAFLSTLRFSPNLLTAFYQLVREGLPDETTRSQLPRAHALDLSDVFIENQKAALGSEADAYASVLITNDPIDFPGRIARVADRRPVYDGVISFGSAVKLFIENKPNKDHVWHGQLSPGAAHVPEQALLLPKPSIVSWRNVVDVINQLISFPSIGGSERQALMDLREFMNRFHGNLNPYQRLDQCGENSELIKLRIQNLLKEIALRPDLVKHHRNWAHYIEAEGHRAIERIGLILEKPGEPDWHLKLFIGFADTVHQARHFYRANLDLSALDRLMTSRLSASGNFHLSHVSTGLLWYATSDEKLLDYIDFWRSNPSLIAQRPIGELNGIMRTLFNSQILIDDTAKRTDLDDTFFNTERKTANIAPGLVLARVWTKEEAVAKDRKGQLAAEVQSSIIRGFELLNESPRFLKPGSCKPRNTLSSNR